MTTYDPLEFPNDCCLQRFSFIQQMYSSFNFTIFPSPPRSVLLLLHSTRSTLGYPQWLTVRENNKPGKRAKTESEAGHFMDSKENKLYYFIQRERLRLKNLTNIFGEEQS